jgi:class 3 adenylate cyclase
LARLRGGLRSDLIDPAIAAHHGRIVNRTGDGSVIEFHSVLDATGWRHLIVRRTDSEQLHPDTRRHEARSFVMVA